MSWFKTRFDASWVSALYLRGIYARADYFVEISGSLGWSSLASGCMLGGIVYTTRC